MLKEVKELLDAYDDLSLTNYDIVSDDFHEAIRCLRKKYHEFINDNKDDNIN